MRRLAPARVAVERTQRLARWSREIEEGRAVMLCAERAAREHAHVAARERMLNGRRMRELRGELGREWEEYIKRVHPEISACEAKDWMRQAGPTPRKESLHN